MKRSTDPTRGFLNALLDLRLEMSTLNHRIAREMRLNDVDLHCLEVLSRKGPSSPAQLTRRLDIHPATMTGILARLEAAGWIARSASPNDRRASVLTIPPKREARLRARYASATQAVVNLISERSDADVAVAVEILSELSARARPEHEG
jgi:DNA-binding MarR family transcriptional regulator